VSWPLVKLQDLVDINIGRTPSRDNPEYWGEGVSWLSIRDMNQGKLLSKTAEQITEFAVKETKCKIAKKGTVLFSFKLSIGKVGFAEIDMFHNEAIAAMPIKKDVELCEEYLYFALLQMDSSKSTDRAVMGATLNKKKMAELEIPLPPLKTQKQIAAVLEKADQLRKDCQKMEQELNSLAQSVFIEMFGDPMTNPKGYEVRDIGSTFLLLTDYHANGSYEVLQENVELLEQGFALMVRTTDLEKNDFINGVKYISEHAYNYLTKTKVFGGELIVNKIGSAGKLYLMPKLNRPVSLAMNQFMVRFDEEKALSVFMYHLLSSQHGFHEISKKVQGAVTKTIRKDALRSIEMPIPPVNEQRTFCEFIEKQNNLLNEQKALAEQYQLQFNALMQKAFNGELNLDNANT
tara:strand:- start:10635 stop:11846 length:1212 start_codon:yes stop_codon:yes gene_type:complete